MQSHPKPPDDFGVLCGVAPLWQGRWLKIATWSHRGHFSHCAAQSAEASQWLRVALRTLLLSGSADHNVKLERPRGRASRSGPIGSQSMVIIYVID